MGKQLSTYVSVLTSRLSLGLSGGMHNADRDTKLGNIKFAESGLLVRSTESVGIDDRSLTTGFSRFMFTQHTFWRTSAIFWAE